MLLVNDSTIESSRLVCQPCQVHGLVLVTRRSVGDFLAAAQVGRAQVLAAVVERVEIEAAGVSVAVAGVATVPLVVRALAASWKRISPRRASESVLRPAQGNRLDQLRRLGVDDLNGIGQIIGHIERLAVGGKGQLGGAAAQLDAPVAGRLS